MCITLFEEKVKSLYLRSFANMINALNIDVFLDKKH